MKASVRERIPTAGVIYISKGTPEPVYGYVRGFKNDEVGFSVLDVPTNFPDFSNCGIFWIKKKDFFKVFEIAIFNPIN